MFCPVFILSRFVLLFIVLELATFAVAPAVPPVHAVVVFYFLFLRMHAGCYAGEKKKKKSGARAVHADV